MADETAVQRVVVAAALAAAVAATHDGRRNREPSAAVWSTRACPWDSVRGNELYCGWYQRHLRCTFSTFTDIVGHVEAKWTSINPPLGVNAEFDIETRVGVTMHYLTHEGLYQVAGSFFGVSKAQAIAHGDQVAAILSCCYLESGVRLPQSLDEWQDISMDFERVCGVPSVVGAIDGSLFPVHRFADHEGWYCRKGFPAFNSQVVVDAKKRIMSYSVRCGSQNDKAVFNNSDFGKICQDAIPTGCYILGDAGYTLLPHVMTPFKIYYGMPRDEAKYNYLHSKMRIIVEAALGLFKGRFRLFKVPLGHQSTQKMTRLISASIVLHNSLVDLSDTTVFDDQEGWMHIGGDLVPEGSQNAVGNGLAKARRNFIKEYMAAL